MKDELDWDGKYDYFFQSKEWEDKNKEKLKHLHRVSIYQDEEFAAICKLHPDILELVSHRATDCMLDRVWRIQNESLQRKFEESRTIGKDAQITLAFHSSSMENLVAITNEGFKQPKTNARQDGYGTLYLGQMIYFAPKLKNGIFYARDTLGYIILADIKLGKPLVTEAHMCSMTPEALYIKGYDSIISHTISSKGTIFAIPFSDQIVPRYLLQYRKLPKTQLLNIARESYLLHHTSDFVCPPVEVIHLQRQNGPYISHGKIHEDANFVCIWDGFPKFATHCLIIPKMDIHREKLSYMDIYILLDMHYYSKWIVDEFKRKFPSTQLAVGMACNAAQIQLHSHIFSPLEPRLSLQKSQSKKFTFPAMRSIRDVIWWLIRKEEIPPREFKQLYNTLFSGPDTADIARLMLERVGSPFMPTLAPTSRFDNIFIQSPIANLRICTVCDVKVHINSLISHSAGPAHRANIAIYPLAQSSSACNPNATVPLPSSQPYASLPPSKCFAPGPTYNNTTNNSITSFNPDPNYTFLNETSFYFDKLRNSMKQQVDKTFHPGCGPRDRFGNESGPNFSLHQNGPTYPSTEIYQRTPYFQKASTISRQRKAASKAAKKVARSAKRAKLANQQAKQTHKQTREDTIMRTSSESIGDQEPEEGELIESPVQHRDKRSRPNNAHTRSIPDRNRSERSLTVNLAKSTELPPNKSETSPPTTTTQITTTILDSILPTTQPQIQASPVTDETLTFNSPLPADIPTPLISILPSSDSIPPKPKTIRLFGKSISCKPLSPTSETTKQTTSLAKVAQVWKALPTLSPSLDPSTSPILPPQPLPRTHASKTPTKIPPMVEIVDLTDD